MKAGDRLTAKTTLNGNVPGESCEIHEIRKESIVMRLNKGGIYEMSYPSAAFHFELPGILPVRFDPAIEEKYDRAGIAERILLAALPAALVQSEVDNKEFAEAAVSMADALIDELEKTKK